MWEPGGASRPEQRGGVGFARVRDTSNSYVVLFDYGSVVFLHFGQEQQEVSVEGGGGQGVLYETINHITPYMILRHGIICAV